MLEVCGLTKRFNGIPAVEDVSFTLKPGEILGYVGPNGAGKSTTVKMIIGLLEPSEGQVCFQGKSVLNDLTGFQARIGYVPEEPHLYPHLSGREYLELVGRLRGLPRPVRPSSGVSGYALVWPQIGDEVSELTSEPSQVSRPSSAMIGA